MIPLLRIAECGEHAVDENPYPFSWKQIVLVVVDDFGERLAHVLQQSRWAFLRRKLFPRCGGILHFIREVFLHVVRRVEVVDRLDARECLVQFLRHGLPLYSLPTNAAAMRITGSPEASNVS